MGMIISDPQTLGAGDVVIGTQVPIGQQRKFVAVGVHNPTGAPIVCKVYLQADGAGVGTGNIVINRTIDAGKTDKCSELIGRGLNGEGKLIINAPACNAGFTSIDTSV